MLLFDADKHIYTYNAIRYMSATQVIELCKPKFDANGEAEKFADKFGRTKEYWLAYWKEINEISIDRGNKIHNLHEEIVNNRSMDVINGKPLRVQNTDMFPQELPLNNYPDGIYTELPICHHGYRIAGKPDKFAFETILGKRYVDIDDYKTNKKLRTHSFKYADGTYQMMKAPLEHLMDCEMVHYTLQLNLYALMFRYHGFIPRNLKLIHFPHIPKNLTDPVFALSGVKDPEPVPYPIEYDERDVTSMLSYLKRKRIIR